MSFAKAVEVFQLALQLQGTSEGLSLADICVEYKVSRRTAERMRDAVWDATHQLEEVTNHGGREKRWRLPGGTTGSLVDPTAEDIADLHRAAELARAQGLAPLAQRLHSLNRKLKAAQKPDARRRNEPDIEALLIADAFVTRAGPRPRLNAAIIGTLREAVRRYRKVRIDYRYRGTGQRGDDIVHPYGFLLGHRHYLVALREKVGDFRNYALGNFDGVEMLQESFARRTDFSLATYAARSFGVFQEKAQLVRWRFKPEAADDVREHLFHPDQKIVPQPDGSLVVTFKAGGLKEMAWHLLTWGDLVEVEAPPALRSFWQTRSFAAAKRMLRPNTPLA
jgi:predicted DNA-binding transcriptional regulator YafY